MPGKILGLDISDDSITAVQVLSGLRGYQIMACARVMRENGGDLDGSLKELLQQMDLKSDTCLASIPGEDISYRNIQMPFKEPKKISQTLPFEMETMVPVPIEDLVVDFTIADRSDQSDVLAVAVKKAFVSEYLSQLQTHGIDPDVLDIRCAPTVSWLLKQEGMPENGLFLEIGVKSHTMVLFLKKRIALIRSFSSNSGRVGPAGSYEPSEAPALRPEDIESSVKSFCEMVKNTIHAFGWQKDRPIQPEKIFFTGVGALYPEAGSLLTRFLDVPAEQINLSWDTRVGMDKNIARVWNPALMDNALALALRDDKQRLGFNFRKDEFEVKRQYIGLKKEIPKVAVFAILILFLVAADLGLDYHSLKKKYDTLDKKITEVFRKTFPDVKRIVMPVQQMQVKIDELKKSSTALPGMSGQQRVIDLLKDISQRIEGPLDVQVTHMVIDPDTVRITGQTDTFNTVDSIKSGLEPSAYFSAVTISSANLDRTGKRVQFELKLERVK